MICVGHVNGEENYDWEMSSDVVRVSRILIGMVQCAVFRGSFMWVFFLYLGITILFHFQMIMWGVLGRVYWGCLNDIVARAILVWLLGWR